MATQPVFEKAVEDLKRDPSRPVRVRVDALDVELRVVGGAAGALGTRLAELGPWDGETEAELVSRLHQARAAGGSVPPREI